MFSPVLPGSNGAATAIAVRIRSLPAKDSGGTGYVEMLVRLQTEAASDDFLPDLGGAAEAPPDLLRPLEAAQGPWLW